MKKQRLAEIGLLACAFLWGSSGILTQIALTEMTPMALILFRFSISSLLGLFLFKINVFKLSKDLHKHGLILSLLMMAIYISSTYGLKYTSASNAGFIIGTSVILVPLFNRFLFKAKLSANEYISAGLCLIGLGLVTLRGSQPINLGDALCLIDAGAYALYIIYNSKLSSEVDVKVLSTVQYIYVTGWSLIYLMGFEKLPTTFSSSGIFAVIVLGVFCTFLAFLIQVAAQRHTSPERTGKILTLIPIFTVILDLSVYGKIMTFEAFLGGALITLTVLMGDQMLQSITKYSQRLLQTKLN